MGRLGLVRDRAALLTLRRAPDALDVRDGGFTAKSLLLLLLLSPPRLALPPWPALLLLLLLLLLLPVVALLLLLLLLLPVLKGLRARAANVACCVRECRTVTRPSASILPSRCT